MKPKIYLVVGVPGVGKSWVCEQLKEKFEYIPHDDYQDGGYLGAIVEAAERSQKPLLIETPFSISKIMAPLIENGETVVPVFVIEEAEVVAERYKKRTGKDIIIGHLTRQNTYAERAREFGAFSGTAAEVHQHLKAI